MKKVKCEREESKDDRKKGKNGGKMVVFCFSHLYTANYNDFHFYFILMPFVFCWFSLYKFKSSKINDGKK